MIKLVLSSRLLLVPLFFDQILKYFGIRITSSKFFQVVNMALVTPGCKLSCWTPNQWDVQTLGNVFGNCILGFSYLCIALVTNKLKISLTKYRNATRTFIWTLISGTQEFVGSNPTKEYFLIRSSIWWFQSRVRKGVGDRTVFSTNL